MRAEDLSGRRFGSFIVIRRDASVFVAGKHRAQWLCLCDCGTEKTVWGQSLRSENTTNCGCSYGSSTHGMSGTPEYKTWDSMRQRCTNPRNTHWRHYGGRGITVCDRWSSFEAFLEDMGRRPSRGLSLDRIDVNGNYEPGNCRWATAVEQARNQRRSRVLTAFGRTQHIAEWAQQCGLTMEGIARRLRIGLPPEQAVREAACQ